MSAPSFGTWPANTSGTGALPEFKPLLQLQYRMSDDTVIGIAENSVGLFVSTSVVSPGRIRVVLARGGDRAFHLQVALSAFSGTDAVVMTHTVEYGDPDPDNVSIDCCAWDAAGAPIDTFQTFTLIVFGPSDL